MKEPKVSLGLVNPKSPENVGAVLRAAANYGIDNVFLYGVTVIHERLSVKQELST